jgi:aldehyde dehydrogenase
MMPFVPFVRCKDADEAIHRAHESEHGFRHTAIIHSNDVRNMTRMGRLLDTTLFVKNGPSTAGLGLGGEGYISFSIATPTGEGRDDAAHLHPPAPLHARRRSADPRGG